MADHHYRKATRFGILEVTGILDNRNWDYSVQGQGKVISFHGVDAEIYREEEPDTGWVFRHPDGEEVPVFDKEHLLEELRLLEGVMTSKRGGSKENHPLHMGRNLQASKKTSSSSIRRDDALLDVINKWKAKVFEMVGEQLDVTKQDTHDIEGSIGRKQWIVSLYIGKKQTVQAVFKVGQDEDRMEFKSGIDGDWLADMLVEKIELME